MSLKKGGQARAYGCLDQVETIRRIKEYLEEGFTLVAAAQKATGIKTQQGGPGKCIILTIKYVR